MDVFGCQLHASFVAQDVAFGLERFGGLRQYVKLKLYFWKDSFVLFLHFDFGVVCFQKTPAVELSPPKMNMSHDKGPSQKEISHLPTINYQFSVENR